MFLEISQRSNERFHIQSFETTHITPQAIYVASANQLKRLLIAFRLSFQPAWFSILTHTVLIYVGNAVLQEVYKGEQTDWQFYLRLCLAALEDLYGSYREAWSIMRAMLSMALMRGAIEPDEASRIMREMIVLGQYHKHTEGVESLSMMDLELATTNPYAAQVSRLAEKFEELL